MTRGKKNAPTGGKMAGKHHHHHSAAVSPKCRSSPRVGREAGGGDFHPDKAMMRVEGEFPCNKAIAALRHLDEQENKTRHSLNWDEFFGSSLDLAPSLLNIYDGKAATGIDESCSVNGVLEEGKKSQDEEDDDDEDDTAPIPSQLASPLLSPQSSVHHTAISSSVASSSPSSSSLVSTSSNIVYRSGKLPSLSQPLDRPVSLMDTDPVISKERIDPTDTKKRPLSVSSMSSVSTSSLPRARKKRANNSRSDSGKNMRRYMGEDAGKEHHSLPSDLVSESYSSMDSGCVESDRNGDRFYDDMSVTSSSEGTSVRDDTATCMTDCVDASSGSLGLETPRAMAALDRSDSSLSSSSKTFKGHRTQSSAESSPRISKKVRGRPQHFENSLSPNVIYPPSALTDQSSSHHRQDNSFDEDSYVIKKMGSYINRNSLSLPAEFPGIHSNDSTVSSPEQQRRRGTSTRNEARARFYSNYEEHFNKYVSSPVDSESSFETLTDSPFDQRDVRTEPTSPITPLADSPLSSKPGRTDIHENCSSSKTEDNLMKSLAGRDGKRSESEAEKSPTSPVSLSAKHFDPRGSSSPASPSGLLKSASSRSSRKREPQDQGSTPSSPVYVSYVQRVVMEIVDSEKTYNASLEDIIYGYLEPLEHMLNMEVAKDDITCLFSNIRDIYHFNRCFLADLERTDSDPIKVAECFVKHNRGFVIYTEYCTNYPSAVEVLTRFMKHPELSELCRDRQMALGHGLPLGAYLLRPVQRILKYHLLLQNIAKNYEKEKKDVPVLKQAFQHMTHMAHHINEMKRKHEHAVRIQEIQSQLEDYKGEDLTRLGDLVLESTFQVYGAKASRQVFLFERGLLITKKKEGGMLSYKTLIKCSNLMLVEVIPNEPLSFHAIPFDNPRAQYTLQARNMEQKRRWCQEIKRLILESFKGRIPDNVKSLVMELGRDHDDDFVSKESLDAVRKHQHTAPEYLEKRRVRRKSGSRMPDFSRLRRHRKNEKHVSNSRGESKSPELQRKAISKLELTPQSLESSSLPNTPVSEPNHQRLFKHSSNPNAPPVPVSNPSTLGRTSDSMLLSAEAPRLTSSVSSSDVSLLRNSEPSSRKTGNIQGKKTDSNVELVRRASSFRTAVRANPVVSVDLSNLFPKNEREKEKSKPKVQKGKGMRRAEWEKHSSSDLLDGSHSRGERISGDEGSSEEDNQDEYVSIKENLPYSSTQTHNSVDALNESHESGMDGTDTHKTCNESTNQGRMHSRSNSLPALVHAVNNNGDVKPVLPSKQHLKSNTDFQSSDNVNHKVKMRGRMSRRDLQDAVTTPVSGRYIKKKHKHDDTEKDYVELVPQPKEIDLRPDLSKGGNPTTNKHIPAFHDSFARQVAEKNAMHRASLNNPNASKDFGSQNLRSNAYSREVKSAKLTNWNSVDKLTKGSMSDLSHVHENPWELNSQNGRVPSPQTFDKNAPLNRKARSSTLPPENARERDNLDWLVYLKRNSLFSKSSNDTASDSKSNRKSTSVLEQGAAPTKEILDLKRRISAHSPYATPPRHLMTIENMKRFGSSKHTDKTVQPESKLKQTHTKSPLATSEITLSDPIPTRHGSSHHSRCASSSSLSDRRTNHPSLQKIGRPFSLDMDRLNDESNKMVAEMEDYISRTSSTESIKSPNKFPMILPTISIEEQEDEEILKDSNRLSAASCTSTSSYESQASSSSDGLAGTLKSKLHNLASHMGKKSETYENICQSPVLSDDEDDSEGTQEPLASSPKSKNTFVPSYPHRKAIADQRGLQTVLREHSLGSASLGSRMAHSVPMAITPKLEHDTTTQCVDNAHITGKTGESIVDRDSKTSAQMDKFNGKISPEQSRYSLPATKEAVEALMPPALSDCDIQQSDSGFSIHSNGSNVSDFTSSSNQPQSSSELVAESPTQVMTSQTKPKAVQCLQFPQESGMKRQNSYESIDSTDSFYERRLSLALSTDGFDLAPTIVHIYDDGEPQGQVDAQPRRSIRDFVQQLEEKFKPVAPKICEVRKRQPGLVIQQKLKSLRNNVSHGRGRGTDSRNGSEDREFTRSKSQPPSQHRRQLTVHNKSSQSIDDINVSVQSTSYASQPKLSQSKSKERLYMSKSNEYINLSPSRENLTCNDTKLSLPKKSMKNTYHKYTHTHSPGHERDWNSYQPESNEDCTEIDIKGQFVHKIIQNPSPLSTKQDQFFSSSDEDEGVLADKPVEKVDPLSSEVDNLVIMKGWVKALITKFQDK